MKNKPLKEDSELTWEPTRRCNMKLSISSCFALGIVVPYVVGVSQLQSVSKSQRAKCKTPTHHLILSHVTS